MRRSIPRPQYPGEPDGHYALAVKNGYEDMPEAYHLYRIPWQVRFTFTLKRKRRATIVTTALRRLCRHFHLHFKREFVAVWRWEKGTLKELPPHIHGLIGGIPRGIDLHVFCDRCVKEWLPLEGAGVAKADIYDPQLAGAAYLAKAGKHFDDEERIIFSPAAWELLTK
jgi:hypothetical protein